MIIIMSSFAAALFQNGREKTIESGRAVFRLGDPVRLIYYIIEGQIDLMRHARSGSVLTLNRTGPGNVLAEASLYSKLYHCDGVASSISTLRTLPVSEFRKKLRDSPDVAEKWTAHLARELQAARVLSEIRSLKTVAERLDAWMAESNVLPPKGRIQDTAHILGVSREALYRELSSRGAYVAYLKPRFQRLR